MSSTPEQLRSLLQPRHTALVIVDMQNDFCADGGYLQRVRAASGMAPSQRANELIAARIEGLARAARASGTLVVWLRSLYDFKYLNAAQIAKRGEEGCCLEDTWGADYFQIRPGAGDVVVTKHTFSGFHGTALDETLRGHGIQTLVMCGVATNVCVDSTLREGFFRGYHIVVAEDCVGSGNRAGHEGTLATVRTNIGTVAGSGLIAGLLKGAGEAPG